MSMLASVLALARDLARLGDPGLAFKPDLDEEGGTKISPGIGTGWVLFLLPSGHPRFFSPFSSFTGSP